MIVSIPYWTKCLNQNLNQNQNRSTQVSFRPNFWVHVKYNLKIYRECGWFSFLRILRNAKILFRVWTKKGLISPEIRSTRPHSATLVGFIYLPQIKSFQGRSVLLFQGSCDTFWEKTIKLKVLVGSRMKTVQLQNTSVDTFGLFFLNCSCSWKDALLSS